ncbi:MAG TPA: hypothetical protein VFR70_07700 [Flavobacterium sp.]|nr:hypothetical protein [Flavobacterium sp.]
MKKIIYTGVVIVILTGILIIKPVRTDSIMQNIAKEDLENILFEQFGSSDSERILNNLRGPLISKNNLYTEFIWYQKLNENDTAKIFINVYRYPITFSLRDDFFWNKITMNSNWSQLK